jgi:hypothetical protein
MFHWIYAWKISTCRIRIRQGSMTSDAEFPAFVYHQGLGIVWVILGRTMTVLALNDMMF